MWLYIPLAYVREDAELSLDLDSQAKNLEQSVMWKSKHSHQRTWLKRLKTVAWMTLLSGVTLLPSTVKRGVERWIYSLPDSPANQYQSQEEDEHKTTLDGSGRTLKGYWLKYNQPTYSWKMCQGYLFGVSETFSETWPKSGSMRNGMCFRRKKSEHHIYEKGSSSWPTPTAGMWKHTERPEVAQKHLDQGKISLPRKVKVKETWPTPTAAMHRHAHCSDEAMQRMINKNKEKSHFRSLPVVVKGRETWRTPMATEGQRPTTVNRLKLIKEGKSHDEKGNLIQITLDAQVRLSETTGGQLNPTWVDWLMGWPIGWSDLHSAVTESYHKWLVKHG